MGLCSSRPTLVSLLTKRHDQLRLQWAREHRDWAMDEWKRVAWSDESRFLIHHVDGRVRVRRLPGKQLLPSCTSGHTQASGDVAPLHGVCLPNWKWNLPAGQRPCHKARIVLEWFQEHTDEFHLMSWPPNSPDPNPMEHISDVMEWQLRAQTPPCPNILTLRDRCLDIWYNLSPVMYQKHVASMPRRVAAVLKAKGGVTRY
ncbi:hypothetical protein AVEN_44669-1 [Araneus ventricosus]|uniref:Tc1-like transposase DDE domain-containing protein n=1 Tax=Araneus ventricosus TaxID=182803 RepID=A0A4Y2QXA6_ARAVE|nr:hypothetical protein AVEN_44669-1 [Araneus ventricosus]